MSELTWLLVVAAAAGIGAAVGFYLMARSGWAWHYLSLPGVFPDDARLGGWQAADEAGEPGSADWRRDQLAEYTRQALAEIEAGEDFKDLEDLVRRMEDTQEDR